MAVCIGTSGLSLLIQSLMIEQNVDRICLYLTKWNKNQCKHQKSWQKIAMLNSRFGYSMKKNSFKGLNIDCIQYSNIIQIIYYSYSYSGTILNPNIIRIRIRPNICARILFVFVFAHSEKTNIIRIHIRSKFWFRILFVFVFGPKNSIRSPLGGLQGRW